MDYRFEPTGTSPQKISQYSKLLSEVFTETKKYTPEFLTWQYDLNPAGKVVGYDAYFGDELAAHYVTIPVLYIQHGKQIKGLLSLNTATHPKHQGKKLFTKLAEKTYELGAQLGYQFVIGVANQNSTHGFITKLGFKLVSPLEVVMFAGSLGTVEPAPNFFQSYWTKDLAEWRLKNPFLSYYKNGQGIICDTHISLIKAVLSQKKEFAKTNLSGRSGLIKMTIGLNLESKKKFLKINLPDKFKPSPLNLIFKSLGNSDSEINSSSIYFELMDFDAY
jgi:GNAT superfamily N-acetyltransferase